MKSMGASSLLSVALAGLTGSLACVGFAYSTAREAGDEDLVELARRLTGELEMFAARADRLVRAATTMADHPFVANPNGPYCATCLRRADYHPVAGP